MFDLGLRSLAEALSFQRDVAAKRSSKEKPQDVLLVVEHPPVITLGRSTKQENVLFTPALLEAGDVELCEGERSGDITYHGLRQLVGHPLVDLHEHKRDLHWYRRQVEEA